ncbi:MAG: hypothetical protein QM831_23960 [Kofleriaceae bacterium]
MACSKHTETPPETQITCEQLKFAASTPVPEASGAAFLPIDGKPMLVVVSDSGNHGAYGIVDPDTGDTVEQGQLPIGDSTDDIEGLAVRGGHLFGITSPGWILEWTRDDANHAFTLVQPRYALGPVDLPGRAGIGDKPPEGDGMVCDGRRSNCGRNYEGICLTETAGYALAKADGHLYPLVGSPLQVKRDGAIAVGRPGVAADCAYDETGALYVGNNLFGEAKVLRVEHGETSQIGLLGIGFPEVLVVRDGIFYRMSDTGGSPSLMSKFRCSRATR